MDIRKQLNRIFPLSTAPAEFAAPRRAFEAGDISGRLDALQSQLAGLPSAAQWQDIAAQLESLKIQVAAAQPASAEERHLLERYRVEQRLLAGWQGHERAELVERACALLAKLRPMQAVGFEKVRVGSRNDGGYILLDDFRRVELALSFGVEQNAEWDLQMAERGVRVRQYDHTIAKPPARHPLIYWEKKRIAETASPETESISSILAAHDRNRTSANAILKIDIEHAEWPVFEATPREDLQAFSQIAGEFHGFDYLSERTILARFERVIEKLTRDFAVVHAHANNYCGVSNYFGVSVPWVMEFTFANRSLYQFRDSNEVFPGPLDAPCDPGRPDLWLGQFRF